MSFLRCAALLALLGCGSTTETGGASGPVGAGDDDDDDVPISETTVDGSRPLEMVDAGARSDARPESTPPGSDPSACATVSSSADPLPVHLAFTFDVSGSMGKGDEEWHDKQLKWDPVVSATRAFFEDGASTGLTAALTFFPADDDKCDAASYERPDVPLTALPSPAFGRAIAEIEPQSEKDWRGGTPTLFAVQGTRSFIDNERRARPGKYAMVLVTDGHPAGCDEDDDSIEAVASELRSAAGRGISTFVIGIANPPIDGAPDTIGVLHQLAAAGGTTQAVLIDTGDPGATQRAFGAAIARIRDTTVSCNLAIPDAPDARPFDKRKVTVRMERSGASQRLDYVDGCTSGSGWRYDDEGSPREIVLCADTCAALESGEGARVEVSFGCEDVVFL